MSGRDQYSLDLVNGENGDPAVYCFFPVTGKAVQFDLGCLNQLSNKKILKIDLVLVSHTHIDHFIGFHRLLRVNIPHRRLITIAGPQGMIAQVSAKLKGYTWNLLEPQQLRFQVYEFDEHKISTAYLSNDTGFQPEQEKALTGDPCPPSLCLADGTTLTGMTLDHGTPSIGYHYLLPERYSVDIDSIVRDRHPQGPWIRELQIETSKKEKGKKSIQIDRRTYSVEELSVRYLQKKPRASIGYLTDFAFHWQNIQKCINGFNSCLDTLVCETSFLDEDRDRAFKKKHLTTKQAALIAAICGAKSLKVFHVSSIYGNQFTSVVDQAHQFFKKYQPMPFNDIKAIIDDELHH